MPLQRRADRPAVIGIPHPHNAVGTDHRTEGDPELPARYRPVFVVQLGGVFGDPVEQLLYFGQDRPPDTPVDG